MIKNYFLFTQPFRKILLRLSDILPPALEERLLNALYPGELEVKFIEGGGD